MATRKTNTTKAEAELKEVAVRIPVPIELYDKAFRILQARGTTIEDYTRLMLLKVRDNPLFCLSDTMTFGQFKGESIDTIIRCDPRYVEWLLNVSEGFALTEEALNLLNAVQGL